MELIKRISKLIDVKSIISLIAGVVFAILALRGDLGIDNTMILLTLVFQSFFSYQHTKKNLAQSLDEQTPDSHKEAKS